MKRLRLLFVLMFVLLLAACKLPASGVTPPATESDLVYTQAVETVSAELTRAVDSTSATSSEVKTTSTEVTATAQGGTPALPAATETLQPTSEPIQAETTATQAPTATSTVQSTAALPSSDPRADLGKADFVDAFNSSENWPLYNDKHGAFEIKDGKLVMTAYWADYYNSWMLSWPNLENFYLEATVSAEQCAGKDRFGLMFRAPDSSQGYLFAFSCDGRYSLWYWDGKVETYVVDWTESTQIQVGVDKVNRIGVKAEGTKISLYANGVLLKDVQNSAYQKGYIGVFIGSAQTEDFTANIDKIEYWDLK
jgi:hypothetical protein